MSEKQNIPCPRCGCKWHHTLCRHVGQADYYTVALHKCRACDILFESETHGLVYEDEVGPDPHRVSEEIVFDIIWDAMEHAPMPEPECADYVTTDEAERIMREALKKK